MFVFTSSLKEREYRLRMPHWAADLYNMLLEDTGLAALGGTPASVECMESLGDIVKGFGCEMIIDGKLAFVRVAYEESN